MEGFEQPESSFYIGFYDDSVLQEQTEVECHILASGEIRMVGYAEPELSNYWRLNMKHLGTIARNKRIPFHIHFLCKPFRLW